MRYLVRLTGDRDAAADVLQETFFRLVERPPTGPNARSWLYTVATNLVREESRTVARRFTLLRRAPTDALHGDAAQDPQAMTESNEQRKTVLRALAALPERDRVVLLMREEGFTHEEIARAVGATSKSVGTIVVRALRKLARALGPLAAGAE